MAAYQAIATRFFLNSHRAPGQLLGVGGRTAHLLCTGNGEPTSSRFRSIRRFPKKPRIERFPVQSPARSCSIHSA